MTSQRLRLGSCQCLPVFQTCLCFGLWFQPVVTDDCCARSVLHRFATSATTGRSPRLRSLRVMGVGVGTMGATLAGVLSRFGAAYQHGQ